MAEMKQVMDASVFRDIVSVIVSFLEKNATLSKYQKESIPEIPFQIDLAKALSSRWNVMREVVVPSLDAKEFWKIDESLQIFAPLCNPFYAVGELKLHGDEMVERDFVEEVKEDLNRVSSIAEKYNDITLSFIVFVSCDIDEISQIEQIAKEKYFKISICSPSEKGYKAIVAYRVPYCKKTNILYASKWKEEYNSLDGKLRDKYFRKK